MGERMKGQVGVLKASTMRRVRHVQANQSASESK